MSASDQDTAPDETRLLVLAPPGSGAERDGRLFGEYPGATTPCRSIEEFCRELQRGAGAGVLAAETLTPAAVQRLVETLEVQPPWSDFPLIILLGPHQADARARTLHRALDEVANATLLERPVRRETLLSAVRVALRARRRQYQIRGHLIERERATEALRQSEARFRLALESSPILMAIVDREQRYAWIYNAPAELAEHKLIGHRLDEVLPADDVAELTRLRDEVLASGRGIRREISLLLPRGRRHYDVAAEPLRDAAGEIVGVTTASSDITGRKAAERHQEMLLAELSHRVKTNMAVVLSIASQTARRSDTLEDFLPAFKGRILALATAHSLLAAVDWKSAELRVIVDQVVHQAKAGDERVQTAGDNLFVQPDAALTLSLVLHELTTNAVKHGALGRAHGRLCVEWGLEANGTGESLHLRWRESGAAAVREPETRGFGLELIERAIAYELSGRTRMVYRPEGLCCEISLPWTPRIGERRH